MTQQSRFERLPNDGAPFKCQRIVGWNKDTQTDICGRLAYVALSWDTLHHLNRTTKPGAPSFRMRACCEEHRAEVEAFFS